MLLDQTNGNSPIVVVVPKARCHAAHRVNVDKESFGIACPCPCTWARGQYLHSYWPSEVSGRRRARSAVINSPAIRT